MAEGISVPILISSSALAASRLAVITEGVAAESGCTSFDKQKCIAPHQIEWHTSHHHVHRNALQVPAVPDTVCLEPNIQYDETSGSKAWLND